MSQREPKEAAKGREVDFSTMIKSEEKEN